MAGILSPGREFAFCLFVVFAASIFISISRAKKGSQITLREIPGYDALAETVGRATEMGKPVHYTPGKYQITIEMMAGLMGLSYVTKLVADYDARMIVTTGRGDTYALADAIVKQGYTEAGKPDAYRPESIRYISDNQFAFASNVMGIMAREQVAANIMIGQFAAESLLLSEAGHAVGAIQVAGTAQTAQLPFFIAACDYVILGEELFAVDAYFTSDPTALGCIRGQDIAKVICIALIIAGVIDLAFHDDTVLRLLR